jgi:hypothetical protein
MQPKWRVGGGRWWARDTEKGNAVCQLWQLGILLGLVCGDD